MKQVVTMRLPNKHIILIGIKANDALLLILVIVLAFRTQTLLIILESHWLLLGPQYPADLPLHPLLKQFPPSLLLNLLPPCLLISWVLGYGHRCWVWFHAGGLDLRLLVLRDAWLSWVVSVLLAVLDVGLGW